MINKPKLIKLGNEIPQKTLNTLIKSYNGIKCYLVVDEKIQIINMGFIFWMRIIKLLETIKARLWNKMNFNNM